MRLPWLALVLTASALQTFAAPAASGARSDSAAAITETAINPMELQALRIQLYPSGAPPVGAAERWRALAGPRANMAATPDLLRRTASNRRWLALGAAAHAAAVFDAWTTQRSLQSGNTHELNPFFRPIAGSPAVYPALQAMPFACDFISHKMMRSSHPSWRKVWWLPQTMSLAASLLSGANNLRFAH